MKSNKKFKINLCCKKFLIWALAAEVFLLLVFVISLFLFENGTNIFNNQQEDSNHHKLIFGNSIDNNTLKINKIHTFTISASDVT